MERNVVILDPRGGAFEVTQEEYAGFRESVRAKRTAYSLIVPLTTNEARKLFRLGRPL